MGEVVKFRRADLRSYLVVDFALGKDMTLGYTGSQLVDTQRTNGVLVNMDHMGSPVLRDDFVDYLDGTSAGLRIPYERMAAIYNALARTTIQSYADERAAYLHKTWTWWSFWRRQGMTAETFAERVSVNERTVRRWLAQLLRHIEKELREPARAEVIIFPASYAEAEAKA